MRPLIRTMAGFAAFAAASCAPDYSPNTYGASAVQQANKVEVGVVIGVRRVDVAAAGTVGAATGAAAGGLVGAQTPGGSFSTAFGTIGGALVGGLIGTATEHASSDTFGYEYIVRKPNNELVSVTQKDISPLTVGQKVLVIAGNQARIIVDYTVNPADAVKDAAAKDAAAKDEAAKDLAAKDAKSGPSPGTAGTAPRPADVTETPLAPPPASASASNDTPGSARTVPSSSGPVPLVTTVPPPPPLATMPAPPPAATSAAP